MPKVTAESLAKLDSLCFDASAAMSAEEWQTLLDKNPFVVCEFSAGELVAAGVAVHAAGIGYLYSLAVAPKYRRHGVGKQLTNARMEYLAARCSRVQAHTHTNNLPSQNNLKSFGFNPIQYVPVFYDDMEDAILWQKVII
jgi:ribosomal protein S18 acetylase RimI-like enzyme